jgi:ATP-binding cassette, subfamily B, multidrug efflux pump
MTFFLGLGALLVLWLGSREVIQGRITLGEFVAFNTYLVMLSLADDRLRLGHQHDAARAWRRGSGCSTCSTRRRRSPTRPAPPRRATSGHRGGIEFRDLTFALRRPRACCTTSRPIEPGQTGRSSGATGSGKSTLISLLAAARPAAGHGLPRRRGRARPAARRAARGARVRAAGAVPLLRHDRPKRRLRRRRWRRSTPSGASASVRDAAAVARLDKDIEALPGGYETMVGERGITLSGGQKQRTALARALAMNPRVLVLDDALSAVDTYTEEEILGRLRGVMRQRTSLIVSHRVSTVRDADQILVLDEGRIVERGTHDELVGTAAVRGPVPAAAARRGARGELTVHARRRDSRQGVRRAADAAAAGLPAAVPPAGGLALGAIVGYSALQLAQPYLTKVAIDRYIAAGTSRAWTDRALFLAVLVGAFVLEYAQTWLMQMTGQRIMYDLRMQIYGTCSASTCASTTATPWGG